MTELREGCQGIVPLPGRLMEWQRQLMSDPQTLESLIDTHRSPINFIDPSPLAGHAAELVEAGQRAGVEVRVFFARKANKALALVDAAVSAGHGIDVSSEVELAQVLARGVDPDLIILTAAVKPRSLLKLALESGVAISIDSKDELSLLIQLAGESGIRPRAVLRLRVGSTTSSRFGESLRTWTDLINNGELDGAEIQGVHTHQHGYAADDRVKAIREAIHLVEVARAQWHSTEFIDIGGGMPMSYLNAPEPWTEFWEQHVEGLLNKAPLTWKGGGLGLHVTDGQVSGAPAVYPMWQSPVRGEWLTQVLAGKIEGDNQEDCNQECHTGEAGSSDIFSIADKLQSMNLRLHVEPGRSLLDGCGLTVARVEARKDRGDGTWLVLLAMNRTQCRSAAEDFLLDPILVPHAGPREPTPLIEGFLVGAYCVEDELLTMRRLSFPLGVAVGDLICFVNTAGYQMHILESASHQIPLARNLILQGLAPDGNRVWGLDDIDQGTRRPTDR